MAKKKQTTREWLKANQSKYDDRSKWITDCANALGVSRRAAENMAPKLWPMTARKKPKAQNNGSSLTESDLRRKHDTVFKVKEAAEKIMQGEFYPEPDFISSLRLKGSYRSVLERRQFEKYRGKVDGIIYWGHPESIQKLKDDRVLS